MRKIVTTTWVSLDGYVAGPNGEMDFVGASFDAEMGKYEDDMVNESDTLLLGRVTYQSFAASWPFVPDNPSISEDEKAYARKLNAMRKIIFSRTLDKVEWNNSRLVKDNIAEEVAKLKQEPGKNMLISGSPSIVQLLTNLHLIDEYQVLVHPVILGGGKPLFAEIKEKVNLKLVNTRTNSGGVVFLTYRV
jgi:dihydrofolate reductase